MAVFSTAGITVLGKTFSWWTVGTAAITAAAISHQRRQAREARADAAEGRGFIVGVDGEPRPVPVIYGRQKVGSQVVGVRVDSRYKFAGGGDRVFTARNPSGVVFGGTRGLTIDFNRSTSFNEFLTTQNIFSEPVSEVRWISVDELDPTDEYLERGLRVSADYDGGANALGTANGFPGTNAFTRLNSATAAFRFDGDRPQFGGTPLIGEYVWGRPVRSITAANALSAVRAYSTNPVLCLLDLLIDTDYGYGFPLAWFDLKVWREAAAICDTPVANLPDGSGLQFYQLGRVWYPGTAGYVNNVQRGAGNAITAILINNLPPGDELALEVEGARYFFDRSDTTLFNQQRRIAVADLKRTDGSAAAIVLDSNVEKEQFSPVYPYMQRELPVFETNVTLDTLGDSMRKNARKVFSPVHGGRLVWSEGQLRPVVRYPTTKAQQDALIVAEFFDTDIKEPPQRSRPESSDVFNQVTARHANEQEDFAPAVATWPKEGSAEHKAFLEQDKNIRSDGTINLPATTDPHAAEAACEYAVRRSRREEDLDIVFGPDAMALDPGDLIEIHSNLYNIDATETDDPDPDPGPEPTDGPLATENARTVQVHARRGAAVASSAEIIFASDGNVISPVTVNAIQDFDGVDDFLVVGADRLTDTSNPRSVGFLETIGAGGVISVWEPGEEGNWVDLDILERSGPFQRQAFGATFFAFNFRVRHRANGPNVNLRFTGTTQMGMIASAAPMPAPGPDPEPDVGITENPWEVDQVDIREDFSVRVRCSRYDYRDQAFNIAEPIIPPAFVVGRFGLQYPEGLAGEIVGDDGIRFLVASWTANDAPFYLLEHRPKTADDSAPWVAVVTRSDRAEIPLPTASTTIQLRVSSGGPGAGYSDPSPIVEVKVSAYTPKDVEEVWIVTADPATAPGAITQPTDKTKDGVVPTVPDGVFKATDVPANRVTNANRALWRSRRTWDPVQGTWSDFSAWALVFYVTPGAGANVHVGVGRPADTLGNDDDIYVQSNGVIWQKRDGAWVNTGIDLTGDPGARIFTGITPANQNTPVLPQGVTTGDLRTGDVYIARDDGERKDGRWWRWDGSAWVYQGDLTGPAGEDGEDLTIDKTTRNTDGSTRIDFSDGTFITIPAGTPGTDGTDGRGISTIVRNNTTGIVTITYTDGTTGRFLINDGQDGNGFEFVFLRRTTEATSALPRPTSDRTTDDSVPTGYTDEPQGVDETNRYEYVSARTGTTGNWSVWSIPELWSVYSLDGEDGPPGFPGISYWLIGYEQVFANINTAGDRKWEISSGASPTLTINAPENSADNAYLRNVLSIMDTCVVDVATVGWIAYAIRGIRRGTRQFQLSLTEIQRGLGRESATGAGRLIGFSRAAEGGDGADGQPGRGGISYWLRRYSQRDSNRRYSLTTSDTGLITGVDITYNIGTEVTDYAPNIAVNDVFTFYRDSTNWADYAITSVAIIPDGVRLGLVAIESRGFVFLIGSFTNTLDLGFSSARDGAPGEDAEALNFLTMQPDSMMFMSDDGVTQTQDFNVFRNGARPAIPNSDFETLRATVSWPSQSIQNRPNLAVVNRTGGLDPTIRVGNRVNVNARAYYWDVTISKNGASATMRVYALEL